MWDGDDVVAFQNSCQCNLASSLAGIGELERDSRRNQADHVVYHGGHLWDIYDVFQACGGFEITSKMLACSSSFLVETDLDHLSLSPLSPPPSLSLFSQESHKDEARKRWNNFDLWHSLSVFFWLSGERSVLRASRCRSGGEQTEEYFFSCGALQSFFSF